MKSVHDNRKVFLLLFLAMILYGAMACPMASAAKITMDTKDIVIDLWGPRRVQLEPVVSPVGASVTWSSSKSKVASVDQQGKVTAKSKGTTLITATVDGGDVKVAVRVVKPKAPSKIRLSVSKNELLVGEKIQLTVKTSPKNRTDAVKWTSSNKKVATVDVYGVVSAVSNGTATIKAVSAANKRATSTIKLTVDSKKPGSSYVPVATPRPTWTPTPPPAPTPMPAPTPDTVGTLETKLFGVVFDPFVAVEETAEVEGESEDGAEAGPSMVNAGGHELTDERINELLGVLVGKTAWIRVDGARASARIPLLAKALGFKVMMVGHLTRDASENSVEVETLKALVAGKMVDCAVVGNEAVSKGALDAEALIGYIEQVKAVADGVAVGSIETLTTYSQNPSLVTSVDWIISAVEPFGGNVKGELAVEHLVDQVRLLGSLAAGKPVVVAASGAPSSWNGVSNGVASGALAEKYLREAVAAMKKEGVAMFVREAFDRVEASADGYGSHYGLYDLWLNMKYPSLLS